MRARTMMTLPSGTPVSTASDMSPGTRTDWISKPGTSHCTSTCPATSAATVSGVHCTSTSLMSEPSDR